MEIALRHEGDWSFAFAGRPAFYLSRPACLLSAWEVSVTRRPQNAQGSRTATALPRTALHRHAYSLEVRYLVNFNQSDTDSIVISTNNSGVVARGRGDSYCRLQIVWRLTTGVLDLSLLRVLPVIVKCNNGSVAVI